MTEEPRCTLKICGTKVTVPICDDIETSERLAKEVATRLTRIEEESPIIDTQKFAVMAAYEFAMECYEADAQHEKDTQDLVKALERLARELRQLVERFQQHPEGPSVR